MPPGLLDSCFRGKGHETTTCLNTSVSPSQGSNKKAREHKDADKTYPITTSVIYLGASPLTN